MWSAVQYGVSGEEKRAQWRVRDMRIDVVPYRPEMRRALLELLRQLWSPSIRRNAECFDWKYRRNPYGETPHVYVALVDGRPVGMRGMYGARWLAGDPPQSVRALGAGDLVVAPDYRSRGLFPLIMRAAQEHLAAAGYEYLLSLSASPVTQLGSLAQGWRSAGDLETLRWKSAGSPGRARWNPVSRFLRGRKVFGALDRNGRRAKPGSGVSCHRRPRPEAMSELSRAVQGQRIRHGKGREFYEWRFDNPFSQYRFLFRGGSQLEGYAVLQVGRDRGQTRVNIVDWEALSVGVFLDLVTTAIRWGGFDNLTIRTGVFSAPYRAALEEAGFREVDPRPGVKEYRPIVLVRPVCDERLAEPWGFGGLDSLDLLNWDFRMIYSDGF